MQARNSYVATVDGVPTGFSDVDSEGYIDMMFVAPRYLGRGVARQLIAHVEARARQKQLTELTANVSITARPFFERSGFTVEAEQHAMTAGVQLTNFKMKKKLVGGEVSLSGQLICFTEDQARTVREIYNSTVPSPAPNRVAFRSPSPGRAIPWRGRSTSTSNSCKAEEVSLSKRVVGRYYRAIRALPQMLARAGCWGISRPADSLNTLA
jgi:predicted GNAT family acetyltransferase